MTTTSALNERRLEWGVATLSCLGGVVIATVATSYGITHSTGVGAGLLPLVAGVLLGLAGVAWLLQLVATRPDAVPPAIRGERDEPDEHAFPTAIGWVRVATLAGAIVVAALLLEVLGYALVMIALLTTILVAIGRRRVWLSLLVAATVALLSQLVFEGWLGTALPHSTLAPFSGWGI